jgi:hypothetical protein
MRHAGVAVQVLADVEGQLYTGGNYIPASFFAAIKPMNL